MSGKQPSKKILNSDGSIPTCQHCQCCPMTVENRKGSFYLSQCNACHHTRAEHGFSSHIEYDAYLRQGCWVCGGIAIGIDHRHQDGCKTSNHSCDKCRRGPVCNRCNCILRAGRTVSELETMAGTYKEKAERIELVAQAMKSHGAEVA